MGAAAVGAVDLYVQIRVFAQAATADYYVILEDRGEKEP